MKIKTTIPVEIDVDEPAILLEEWGDEDCADEGDILCAVEAALDDALDNVTLAGCSFGATCNVTKMHVVLE